MINESTEIPFQSTQNFDLVHDVFRATVDIADLVGIYLVMLRVSGEHIYLAIYRVSGVHLMCIFKVSGNHNADLVSFRLKYCRTGAFQVNILHNWSPFTRSIINDHAYSLGNKNSIIHS